MYFRNAAQIATAETARAAKRYFTSSEPLEIMLAPSEYANGVKYLRKATLSVMLEARFKKYVSNTRPIEIPAVPLVINADSANDTNAISH